jgi:hypothetical protein
MTDLTDLPWKSPAGAHEDNERVIDHFSTHWMKYVAPIGVYLLLEIGGMALLLFTWQMNPMIAPWLSLLLCVPLLLAHHWFFRLALGRSLDSLLLTDRRIIIAETNLWVTDDTAELSLHHINAVDATKRGILQHVFDYGTLWFDTGGSATYEGKLVTLVPHPHHRASLITKQIKEYAASVRHSVD